MTDSEDIQLGVVEMTNDQYHDTQGISKSHLDCVHEKSLRHYWDQYINPDREPRNETPAMKKGTACHTAILEPDLVDQHIVRGLDIDRRSNANKARWAEFEAEHADKVIISDSDYTDVLRIRDAVHAHPVASGLLKGGRAEQSFFAKVPVPNIDEGGYLFDHETGEVIEEIIKCRTDYMHDGGNLIVDLKKTVDASPRGFAKSVANYRYDVQTAWYYFVLESCFGWVPENWVFIALEESRPYAIGIYFLDQADISRAHNAAMRDFYRISSAKLTNHFPDYGEQVLPIEMPGWVRR